MQAFSRRALHAAAPLGVAAFWCGLSIAAERYPSEYDWRYMTISSLLYPDRNPDGYLSAWGGVLLCGAGGLCWVSALIGAAPKGARRMLGVWALFAGYVCMVCCAVLPAHFLHLSRSHDALALAAFVGVCIGTVQLAHRAVDRNPRARGSSSRPRIWAGAVAGAPLLPLLLVSIAQAYVSHALPQLPWVGLEWRERGVPAYLSFAFWEWVTCVVFSVYTSALSMLEFA